MNYYLDVIKQYVAFDGRARRKEYWMFQLFHSIIIIALVVVDSVIGTLSVEAGLGLLSGIYLIATLLPNLGVSFRRLHDTGKSGWWFLISLIPLIGPIVLLVFMVSDSQSDQNQYGPNPKASETV